MSKNLFTLTLLKTISILDCFEGDDQEIGIKEIAEMIDMPQSSVYRIVQSLEFTGLIFQNRENKKYRLGAKVLQMSTKLDRLQTLMDIAKKYMKMLNEECDETINLAIADCDDVVNVYKVESSQLLRPNFVSGKKYPILTTGLGKIFLADMPTATQEWVYENRSDEIEGTFEEFKERNRQVKTQGYALDDEEFNQGLRCVAVPIYGYGGKVLFSMSISAPTIRMDDQRYAEAIELARKYGQLISREIQETQGQEGKD